MSISKAAANDQHFMSTGSPITEDGIPIRTMAVFNRNVLLEINDTTFKH